MADFPPTHPGEVLREDFLRPLGMSQYALAKALGVPEMRISELVHGKRAITPDTALRLARYFGTSAEFWLGMQMTFDLEQARERDNRGDGPSPRRMITSPSMGIDRGAPPNFRITRGQPELPVSFGHDGRGGTSRPALRRPSIRCSTHSSTCMSLDNSSRESVTTDGLSSFTFSRASLASLVRPSCP